MMPYVASMQQISIVEQFLNPKPVLDEIYQFLRCIEYTEEDGKVIEKPLGDPLINNNGIPIFLATIKGHINSSTVQANMNSDQIKKMMQELNIDIIQLIASRWEKFGIKKAHFDVIVDIIDHHVEAFLSRTLDDKERERFKLPGIRIENPPAQPEKVGGI